MSGSARRSNIAVQRLCQAGHKLVALVGVQGGRGARGKNEVAVEVYYQGVGRGGKKGPALRGNTENVRARFLHELLCVPSVNHRNVQTAPLVNTDAVAHRLRSHGKHRWVVADKDYAASGRYGGFNDTDNVRN